MIQEAPELEGWEAKKGRYGFFIYTHPDFEGCIRLNPVNGTAEVFLDKPPDDPLAGQAVFTETGYPGFDGEEQLARAKLFVEARPISIMVIKEYCPSVGKVVVRSSMYAHSLQYLLDLLGEAQEDFPTLSADSVTVVHFSGRHYKGTFGIEFGAQAEDVPSHYDEIGSLEETL